MQSQAATVGEYLKQLPEDRRAAIAKVRAVLRKHLPEGVSERMQYGMIGYVIPHKLYPAGYHCDPEQPLPFAALASQKNYMPLYLCSMYQSWNRPNGFDRGSPNQARNSTWERVVSGSGSWTACRSKWWPKRRRGSRWRNLSPIPSAGGRRRKPASRRSGRVTIAASCHNFWRARPR